MSRRATAGEWGGDTSLEPENDNNRKTDLRHDFDLMLTPDQTEPIPTVIIESITVR